MIMEKEYYPTTQDILNNLKEELESRAKSSDDIYDLVEAISECLKPGYVVTLHVSPRYPLKGFSVSIHGEKDIILHLGWSQCWKLDADRETIYVQKMQEFVGYLFDHDLIDEGAQL